MEYKFWAKQIIIKRLLKKLEVYVLYDLYVHIALLIYVNNIAHMCGFKNIVI